MKIEYKIKFDHSKEKFGETVDVSDDRLHEIKDIVYHAVTNMSKCDEQHTKSEVLETIMDDYVYKLNDKEVRDYKDICSIELGTDD